MSIKGHRASCGFFAVLVFFLFVTTGCQKAENTSAVPVVVASTTIIGDVVSHVAGNAVEVKTLLPYGASPHDYNPTPKDVVLISKSDVVFINGLGLESQMKTLFTNVKKGIRIISLSEYIKTRELAEEHDHDHHDGHHHHHGSYDPHVWTDPSNVQNWVDLIQTELTHLVPDSAQNFKIRAKEYSKELEELDVWIAEEINALSSDKKKLVTDHKVFGYFADKYGFQQVGAVIPSFSSLSEPSARDIAQLEELIREYNVPVIFVGKSASQTIPRRISSDLNLNVVPLLTGSLEKEGEASTYQGYMRYNVGKIVEALR
jgi:ABC-type Zn uptake system ZnuABC Zn-binding protein ZnuA